MVGPGPDSFGMPDLLFMLIPHDLLLGLKKYSSPIDSTTIGSHRDPELEREKVP